MMAIHPMSNNIRRRLKAKVDGLRDCCFTFAYIPFDTLFSIKKKYYFLLLTSIGCRSKGINFVKSVRCLLVGTLFTLFLKNQRKQPDRNGSYCVSISTEKTSISINSV